MTILQNAYGEGPWDKQGMICSGTFECIYRMRQSTFSFFLGALLVIVSYVFDLQEVCAVNNVGQNAIDLDLLPG